MAKHPVMVKYAYELKENLARRAIALFIDLVVVGIPLFFLFVFMGLGVLQANPMNAVVGLLGPLFYNQEVEGVSETSPFLAMIVFVILQSFMLPVYYAWRESHSRRTVGKKLMHLDPLRKDGMFPTKWDGFQRNYLKYFAGAIGGYLLGFLGWFLFIGVACLIDLKVGPEYKYDLRQRFTELPFNTAALNERAKVPFGQICVDQGKWAKLKESERKAKEYARKLKREQKAKKKMDVIHAKSDERKKKIKLSLEKESKEVEEILEEVKSGNKKKGSIGLEKPKAKKSKPLLITEEEPEDDDLDLELDAEEEEDASLLKPKKEKKPLFSPVKKEKAEPAPSILTSPEEDEEEEKIEEETEKKVPFWKKLFGGGKKEEEPEEEKESERKMDLDLAPVKKDSSKDEVILQFMMDFDVDEKRAHGLYDMGYRKKEDLKDAIPQDLMMIQGVNPTIAKRILKKANE